MTSALTVEFDVQFTRKQHGQRVIDTGDQPRRELPLGRIPRVSKLMALAIRMQELVESGDVASYADIARLGHVTRARITQIMNLLLLAPDIQEEILFLPRVEKGRDPILMRMLQPIALTADWKRQRRMWRERSEKESVVPLSNNE